MGATQRLRDGEEFEAGLVHCLCLACKPCFPSAGLSWRLFVADWSSQLALNVANPIAAFRRILLGFHYNNQLADVRIVVSGQLRT